MIKKILFLLIFPLTFAHLSAHEVVAAKTVGAPVKLPISIFVSVGAHLDFCQKIGAERVLVKLALAPGKSPATYAPTPQQVQLLSQSRLYLKAGLPFETALLGKLKSFPHSPEIVDVQTGIKLQPMQGGSYAEVHEDHSHHHHHDGLDPHSWLDPRLALQQATTIHLALTRIDPDGRSIYRNNFNLLKIKLKALDKELRSAFAPYVGSKIFVYHPAFGYFARAFGLQQRAIEIAGKKPKAQALANIIKEARAENVSALFVQPQFDQQSANKVAQVLGCAVIRIDPLSSDYCHNLKSIAAAIRENITSTKSLN